MRKLLAQRVRSFCIARVRELLTWNPQRMRAACVEWLIPVVPKQTKYGTISFFCPGKLPEYRARTLLTKEPDTIEWIDRWTGEGAFWDIGANVGVFTLYAAKKGLNVLSFEPSPANYFILSRNVELNKLDSKVSTYCLAFCETPGLDYFFMRNTDVGSALNSFGIPITAEGKYYESKFRQAMIGFTIDEFIQRYNPTFPTYIKIDVDGIEDKILNGAQKTLEDSRLKSLLVELDCKRADYCATVIAFLASKGFVLVREAENEYPDNFIFRRRDV